MSRVHPVSVGLAAALAAALPWLAAAGPGGGFSEAPTPAVPSAAGWPPARCGQGERWELDLELLRVTAARAVVDVERPCHAAAGGRVRGEANTTPIISWLWRIHDVIETDLAPDGLHTVQTRIAEDENGRVHERLDRYAATQVVTEWRPSAGGAARVRVTPAPLGALDPFTVLLLLRAHPLPPAAVLNVPVFSKDAVYDGTVVVLGRAVMDTSLGRRPVIHLRATFMKGGVRSSVAAEIWLTDDGLRLPVRVDAVTSYGRLRGLIRRIRPARD